MNFKEHIQRRIDLMPGGNGIAIDCVDDVDRASGILTPESLQNLRNILKREPKLRFRIYGEGIGFRITVDRAA